MPTPVNTARQCLTQESAQALDEAVAVARRRGHAQTTSLHAVSALLGLPSSALREACARARNNSYSSRIQFKALELCLSVSLDRLPSSVHRADEPPVSNSLMAAIKRSQANQRRQPESFHLYQQQQLQSSVSTVKVEIQNLIISILDDPVVSRVFGEAGFRNCDIKLAILRPVHQLFRYKRLTPTFLCNLGGEFEPGFRGFSFPFLGFNGVNGVDENCKRIGEILVSKKGRNPILVGVSALEVLKNFVEIVQARRGGSDFLPFELSGLRVISIENDVSKLITKNYDGGMVKLRFDEVRKMVEESTGPGVIINVGGLKAFVGADDDVCVDAVRFVVTELSRLMENHGKRVWLIGVASGYETYLKFVNGFPEVEKDWDLQLLPITSPRPSMGKTHPRSSLTESFVPLGGFFSTPPDMKSPLRGPTQCVSRCHLCSEKCEQEVIALSKGEFTASIAYQYPSSLPSWLDMPEPNINGASDVMKANDSMGLSAKVARLQKKWDNICQRLHYVPFLANPDTYRACSQVPTVVGFQVAGDMKESVSNHDKANSVSNANSKSMNVKVSETKGGPGGSRSPHRLSNCSAGEVLTSSTSGITVMTDLGLGFNLSTPSRATEKPSAQSSSCPDYGQFGHKDFKEIYTSLTGKIGRQESAVSVVSRTIARCRTKNERRCRGDIWLNFLGPDRLCQKKIAVALAEILYGGKENFMCVDLCFEGSMNFTEAIFGRQEMNNYDIKLRGKTVVDHIADELRKKPLSVVFLENIDKSDPTVQSSLSYAVRNGRLSDSHGREVSIGNSVLVTTSRSMEGNKNKIFSSMKKNNNFLEEHIVRARGWPIQILVGFDLGDNFMSQNSKASSNPVFMNKRKLTSSDGSVRQHKTLEVAKRAHVVSKMSLDLNLPAEESETSDIENSDSDPVSESTKAWLEDFLGQVDETVIFNAFDYDALADKIEKEITRCFYKIIGSEGSLEIDSNVMDQILAAECLSENGKVNDWVNQVLGKAFEKAQKRYNLSSRSVVKLVTCEGRDEAPEVFLPANIIMN